MDKKTAILGSIVLLVIGCGIGYFAKPTKIETRTVEVVKTIKEEATVKTVFKERIVYKDGTVKETEMTKDEAQSRSLSDISKSSETIVKNDVGLNLSMLAMRPISDVLKSNTTYGISVKKRVLGNITAGAILTTDKVVGISIGMDF